MPTLAPLVAFLIGIGVGGTLIFLLLTFWDWRSPSSQRAFRKMWRLARKMDLQADELVDVVCAMDLSGDRLLPFLRIIRDEELSLEQSTEALDRLRTRIIGYIPENIYGWRRSQVGKKAYPELDKRLALARVPRGGAEDPVGDFADIDQQVAESQKEMLDLVAKADARHEKRHG